VRVFDLNGRLVRTVHDSAYEPAGDRDIYFNGKDDRGMSLASGRYFVYVQTPTTREADPITILK
jgi:flagellar hook assembly protein FlgD